MTGCWGGLFAAASCPHVGCETTTSTPDVVATDGGHADHHGHDAVRPEDHSGHVKAHEGHAAGPTAQDQSQFNRGEFQSVAPQPHDQFCSHCVSRPEAPPTPCYEWQTASAKRGGTFVAPLVATQIEAPAPVFLREITPAQHAPPGRSDRRLLLNVFRI